MRAARRLELPVDQFRFPAARSGVGSVSRNGAPVVAAAAGTDCGTDDRFLPVEWTHSIRNVRSADESNSGIRSAANFTISAAADTVLSNGSKLHLFNS